MSSEQEDSRSTAEDQGCTTDDPPSAIIECGKITQNFTIVKLSLLLCDEPFVSWTGSWIYNRFVTEMLRKGILTVFLSPTD